MTSENPKKKDKRRRRMTLLALAAAIAVAAAFAARSQRRRAADPAVSPALLQKAAALRARFASTVAAVRLVAKGDPYDERLAERFALLAAPGFPAPGNEFRLLPAERPTEGGRPLLFIMANEEEAANLPLAIETPFLFVRRLKAVINVYQDSKPIDRRLSGAFILHELVHWDDAMSGRMDPSAKTAEEKAASEVRAYDIEYAALDRAFGGELKKAISRAMSEPGMREEIPGLPGVFQPTDEGASVALAAFNSPPLNSYDLMWRKGTVTDMAVYGQAKNVDERIRFYMFHSFDSEHKRFDIRNY